LSDHAPGSAKQRTIWTTLVANSNWNFAAFGVVVMLNFFTLPIVVYRIGMPQFGIGGLVLAMLAPLMFVGVTIGQACVCELAPMLAERRIEAARQMFSSALALCLFACTIVLVAFGLGGSYLTQHLVGSDADSQPYFRAVCLAATVGWIAQQLLQIFQATITSTQQFRALAALNVVSAIASSLCLLMATWVAPTVLGFLSGTALGFIMTLLFTVQQSRRHAKVMFPLMRPKLGDIQRILAFCRWQAPAQIAGGLALQTDRYLLGGSASMSVVGQFNVATRLQEVVYMGVLKISEVLFPHFSASAEHPSEQASVFLVSSWLINTIAAVALAPLIALSSVVITLWVDAGAAQFGAPMLRTLITAGIIGSGMNVLTYFAMSRGYTRQLGIMALAHSIAVGVCSTLLIFGFGPLAAGGGFLVANVLRLVWAIVITPHIIGNRMPASEVALSTLPPLAAGLFVGWFIDPVPATNWLAVFWNYALIGLTVFIASLALSLVFAPPRTLMLKIYAGVYDNFTNR